MYQIDNSTAAQAIPASTAAGNKGYFTDGNPATGTPATILPAEFMNMLMMENINVLAAAGIQPDKSKFNQLALAISTITGSNLTWANLGGKPTTSAGFGITDVYTKTQMDAFLLGKANSANTIAGYNITDAYTKQQTDAALSGKADKATTLAGYNITDAYTKTQNDASLAGKANKATTLAGYNITDGMLKNTGGIGATIATSELANAFAVPYAGLWSVTPNTQGVPFSYGSLLHTVYDSNQSWTQIAVDMAGGGMYWRGSINGSVQNFKKLLDESNFNPNTKIQAINCPQAGFTDNTTATPFMTHSNGATVGLASVAYSVLGFQIVKGDTGYIKLPDFLGGFIMQWTKTPVLSTNTTYTWSFPLGFPTKCAGVSGTQIGVSQGPLEVSVAPTQASVGLAIGIQTAAVGPAFAWAWGW
ncbi:hypothetical protein ACI77N_12995 [Pseudomonas sp. S191]|uniref:gp53-like domain-containing protein n=1 Tax=Pseudomonas sp. S191 TaxID=579575 RepID=UPI00387A9800